MHLPFAHLKTIAVTLDRARTPRECQPGFDYLIVFPQAGGKTLKPFQAAGGSSLQPCIELIAEALAHEVRKVVCPCDRLGQLALQVLPQRNLRLGSLAIAADTRRECLSSSQSVVQPELYRDQHPDSYRLATAAGRLKAPALYGLDCRRVEFRVAGRTLDLHGLHPALLGYPHLEQHRAFNALLAY
jgi:hypothetical protein